MATTWPRLPAAQVSAYLQSLMDGETLPPLLEHPHQFYAAVGERARPVEVKKLRKAMVSAALRFGFPEGLGRNSGAFDREAATLLHSNMPITWAEASTQPMWTWMAMVLLPDLTAWRWAETPTLNAERWVTRDITRHTWGRLWWQAETFKGHEEALSKLQESELNQVFERRDIGGNSVLAVVVVEEILRTLAAGEIQRRPFIRDVFKRLRRVMTFTDPLALTRDDLARLAQRVTRESAQAIQRAAPPHVSHPE